MNLLSIESGDVDKGQRILEVETYINLVECFYYIDEIIETRVVK